jgi:Zn-finger nucleic acid-binding protein
MSVSQSDFGCPRCQQALTTAGAPDVTLHGCGTCGGIWLSTDDSRKAIEGLASPTVEMVKAAGQNATKSPDESGWVACPECSRRMERNHFEAARLDVDYCPEHGTWFDQGELLAVHHAAMGVVPQPVFHDLPAPMAFEVAHTSGTAIAGFVLSFFCGIVGLIVSWIALDEIKKSEGALKGEGLAMAGIAISALSMVLGCLISLAGR